MKAKVLIVEDEAYWQKFYSNQLADVCIVLPAVTLGEARELCAHHCRNLASIVVDDMVHCKKLNTISLIKEFKENEKFTGYLIAAPADRSHRPAMKNAGCHYDSNKEHVPGLVRSLLKKAA